MHGLLRLARCLGAGATWTPALGQRLSVAAWIKQHYGFPFENHALVPKDALVPLAALVPRDAFVDALVPKDASFGFP